MKKTSNNKNHTQSVDAKHRNLKTSHMKSDKQETDILYAVPSKPLDFSFRTIKQLEMLIKTEARSGNRRPVKEIEREEKERLDNTLKMEKNTVSSFDEEEMMEKKPKKKELEKNDASDFVEMRINDKAVDNVKGKAQGNNMNSNDEKLLVSKKKVKFNTYTNAVILHNNSLTSLANIDTVLNEVILMPKFLDINSNKKKLDLIQWLDLSHNHLQEIHADISKLRFLKILYLHANFICEIENASNLRNCQCLINLTLHGNSIEHIKGYRNYIIELVPRLEKLDFTLVSEKELDIIHFKGSRYGEIRDKAGNIIAYPKLDDRFKRRPKDEKSEDNKNNYD